jgi:hypothetical protein
MCPRKLQNKGFCALCNQIRTIKHRNIPFRIIFPVSKFKTVNSEGKK